MGRQPVVPGPAAACGELTEPPISAPPLSRQERFHEVQRRYASGSWLTRAYIWLRVRYYPLAELEARLPADGEMADLGCGYGVLALLLAFARPSTRWRGFDLDDSRLAAARLAADGLSQVSFHHGDAQALEAGRYRAVLLIDTLHHVPHDQQPQLLRRVAEALTDDGVLLLHETDPSASRRLHYWWNYLSDVLLYPLGTRCQFRSPEEVAALAADAGLLVTERVLTQAFGFSTILYVCRKTLA